MEDSNLSWDKARIRRLLDTALAGSNVSEEEILYLTGRILSIYGDGRVDGMHTLSQRLSERWAKEVSNV